MSPLSSIAPVKIAAAADEAAADENAAESEEDLDLTPEQLALMKTEINAQTAKDYHAQSGKVSIQDKLASINLPEDMRFLAASDARKLNTEWGNLPDDSILGLVYSNDDGLFNDGSWAIFITYSEEGHVNDDDAAGIDYDELLESIQADAKTESVERAKQGLSTVEIVGWAAPPHYDSANKKLHWAKSLRFQEPGEAPSEDLVLNYSVRVLGRKGVLELNAVGDVSQLAQLKPKLEQILSATEFQEGSRYADFDPSLDEVAAYGIGALVAGKIAAKVGLFAVIAKFGAKLFVPVGIAGAAIFKKLTGRGDKKAPAHSPRAEREALEAKEEEDEENKED